MSRLLLQIVYLSVTALITVSAASAQVAFPINSQLPPVAFVSQQFELTFSPNTFSGAASDVLYTLVNQPAWLSIDGLSRQLSGTPTSNDIGAPVFSLIASDNSGRTSSSVTLVVLERKRLYVASKDILLQLANTGVVSAPNTLVLLPEQYFAFAVQPGIFGGISSFTNFYAVSEDRSPLPSWLQFDSKNIRFSGTAPPLLGQGPSQQIYKFDLVASDVVGFSEASIPFMISITSRVLVFTSTSFVFSASQGILLQVPTLLVELRINGAPVGHDQMFSASATPPSWLHFNESDLSFSGIPPGKFDNFTFPLEVGGTGTNIASTTITIMADGKPDVSQTSLGNASVAVGSYFSYVVNQPPSLGGIVRTIINGTNLPSWLSFTASNNTLHGQVPYNLSSGQYMIRFIFSNGLRTIAGVLTLTIDSLSTTSLRSSSTVSGTPMATNSAETQSSDSNSSMPSRRLRTILLAVLLPVVVLFVLVGIVFACRQRKKPSTHDNDAQQQAQILPSLSPPPLPPIPSQPRPQESAQDCGVLSTPGAVLPYAETTEATGRLPQVGLSWAPDSPRKTRSAFSKKPRTSHSSLVGSSWDDLIDFRARSKDSLPQLPFNIFQRRQESTPSSSGPKTIRMVPKRPSRPDSLILPNRLDEIEGVNPNQRRSIGLPKRMSAAGHGAGSGQSRAYGDDRSSWHTTFGSMPMIDRRRSTLIMSSFPQPPSHDSSERVGARTNTKLKIGQGQDGGGYVEESSDGSQWRGSTTRTSHAQKARHHSGSVSRVPRSAGNSSLLTKAIDEDEQMFLSGPKKSNPPPPLPQKSQARSSFSHTFNPIHTKIPLAGRHLMERETSTISSHQFDSAISSDSQWEDESMTAIENEAERAHRMTNVSPLDTPVLPRVPPRSITRDQSLSPSARAASDTRQHQLAGRRDLSRSDSSVLPASTHSEQGSFRFI